MSIGQALSPGRSVPEGRRNKGLQARKKAAKSSAARNISPEILRWLSYLLSVRGLAPSTVERYRYLLVRSLSDIDLPLGQVTRAAIEANLKRLYLAGAGPSVREGSIVALRGFFEWAAANGITSGNPAIGLVGPVSYKREVSVLTVGEVDRLIWGNGLPKGWLGMRNRALLAVAYFAGLRAGEIGRLREEHLRWDEGRKVFSILVVRAKASLGDVRLTLDRPVSRLLGSYLRQRPESTAWLFPSWRGTPLSRSAIRNVFLLRLGEAGIDRKGRRLSPHALRHSIATHLLHNGVDIKSVQLHLRHRSLKTTELYLHSNSERVVRALVKMSPLERARGHLKSALPGPQRLAAELAALTPDGE